MITVSHGESITAALKRAAVSMKTMRVEVRAGEYHENVLFPPATTDIDLVAVGEVHIIAPDSKIKGLGGGGCKRIKVEGFHVTGGKNGIQFSMNGSEYVPAKMIADIVIRRCRVDGVVQDGIKVNGGRRVVVSDCDVTGGNDQGIDFFAILGGDISNCRVDAPQRGTCGIVVKGGSADIRVARNILRGWQGVRIGDPSGSAMWPGADYEASRVLVFANDIDCSGLPIAFRGATDSEERLNALVSHAKRPGAPLVSVGWVKATKQHGMIPSRRIKVGRTERVEVAVGNQTIG